MAEQTSAKSDTIKETEDKVALVETAEPTTKKEKTARVAVISEPNLPVDDGYSSDEDDNAQESEEIDDSEILSDLPDDTEDIHLMHSRLSSVGKLGLSRFTALKKLCLRTNFISTIDLADFEPLKELEELDFYDNKIKHIGNVLNHCTKLDVLDLSFNLLRHVPDNLHHLTSLHTVYFVQNKISHIRHLEGSGATLRSLELGGNRIRKIEGLDALVNLEELWLGKNKIARLENLGNLKRLKILSIQSNRITKLEGLEGLESLEELYLSHNGIEKIEGLENNLKLRTFDIAANFVKEIENVSHLKELEELWINNNQITSLDAIEPQLKHISTLETVYLEGNPIQAKEGAHYRRKITLLLPQIKQLDATYVKQS